MRLRRLSVRFAQAPAMPETQASSLSIHLPPMLFRSRRRHRSTAMGCLSGSSLLKTARALCSARRAWSSASIAFSSPQQPSGNRFACGRVSIPSPVSMRAKTAYFSSRPTILPTAKSPTGNPRTTRDWCRIPPISSRCSRRPKRIPTMESARLTAPR